ncbi:translin family protein [Sporobolomyces koalae]|uniref:translin family protein n=1 Tax=Sporobolomyces koalae TaxID=500713 RepID=UPI003180850B
MTIPFASTSTGHPAAQSTLQSQFTSFRAELDASQAQRERIVKISRDITALSKQMIFALHRVASGRPWSSVKSEVETKLNDLRVLFAKVQAEVRGEDFWRYERSISPGLQEYLEGYTFYYYLEHRNLPTLAQCQASLVPPPPPPATGEEILIATETSPQEPYVVVTVEDYLGGVADLTGEMMRLAIASVGKNLSSSLSNNPQDSPEEDNFADIDKIARVVREIKGEMDPLAPYARWLNKKLQVLDQSLGKIENASYNLKIRGAEYKDADPKLLQQLALKMASSNDSNRRDEVAV